MKTKPNSENAGKRLQDNVILLINGLSESGRVLAGMLSQQGADVVIAASVPMPELTWDIRQDVAANGRRCLLLTSNSVLTDDKKAFSQQAIQKIIETFGRLDAFVTYSAADSAEKSGQKQSNGTSQPILFDQQGLTKAAMKKILEQ